MSPTSSAPPPAPTPPVRALAWQGGADTGRLVLLDQTRLPDAEVFHEHSCARDVVQDIRRLAVRGAPAIGVAGAYALVLAARELLSPTAPPSDEAFAARLEDAAETIAAARPTAVNLRAAVARSLHAWRTAGLPAAAAPATLLDAARRLEAYEAAACAAIGEAGATRLGACRRVITHCNTGSLVTPGIGTALAPLYVLHAQGASLQVWVDETRPLLQGLRLTAWELRRAGIPHAVIVDGAAADLMRRGEIDAAIVGADRVCRNGDVVNKVGTYALAVACRHHRLPFFVAAPLTTLDPDTPGGEAVAIEDRPGDVTLYLRPEAAPAGLRAREPAFDVTPAALVSALITDAGVLDWPDEAGLTAWMEAASRLQRGREAGR